MEAATVVLPASKPMPRMALPAALAFVAGFVDVCCFLAFAGLFVAQVTGSVVVVGSELAHGTEKFALTVLAIPVFILAGMATTFIVRLSSDKDGFALIVALCIELLLLFGLVLSGVAGGGHSITLPGLFGLAAMGVQSAAARLLFSDFGSTNVMTTNTTQMSLYLADSMLTSCIDQKMFKTAIVMIGFFCGVVVGALFFTMFGLVSVLFPIVIIIALALIAGSAMQAANVPA